MKKKFYIVWNEAKSEGFVTDDYEDAMSASDGEHGGISSTIGDAFFDAYGEDLDEPLIVQEIELEV